MTTAKEAAETLGNFVNNYCHKPEEFVEAMSRQHRTLQQSATGLMLLWLKTIASEDYPVDGRNEYAQKIARKLLNNVEDWELHCPLI